MDDLLFAWDEKKNEINRKKHKVGFEAAKLVFSDQNHKSRVDRHERGEERWQTLGQAHGVVLLVAHTTVEKDNVEVIRIISARKATQAEEKSYWKG